MKVGNLVKHKEIFTLGYGLVTKTHGAHCMVQWAHEAALDLHGPTLEPCSMLEIINESR